MYGQKQAPLMWEQKRNSTIMKLGMEHCPHGPLVFKKEIIKDHHTHLMIVLVCTNDFAFVADKEIEAKLDNFIGNLGKKFTITVKPCVGQFISIFDLDKVLSAEDVHYLLNLNLIILWDFYNF
ncbi:hypothetical protein HK100_006982 [Physocladia obscura]|uniref:Uncharacterized protein n=1 Tax=Physocladia obscura TaxID=109957 RepID=A0AAD5SS92_9FUNG|nr:hypothetical protein HK100_006982 [Physocladia obscura]